MRRITLAAVLAACVPLGVLAQPQADWVQANADVGRNLRGHIDILKWEAARATPAEAASTAPASAPLTPAQAVALALKSQPGLMASPQPNALARARLDAQVLQLTHRVQRAWVNAVAARQTEAALQQVADAAHTGAELAQRMAKVGNWSRAQLLQEQLVQSAAARELAMAQLAAFSATEDLVRLLGLQDSAAQLSLPEELPALPASVPGLPELQATALRRQPELILARLEADQASASVTPAHLLQWQQAVDAALHSASQPTEPALGEAGATPVLDPRQVPLTHTLERAIRAQAQVHTLTVATQSQVREAHFRWRNAADMAQHQREAATLTAALQDETQLRYNGMLQSTWDLLASARARLQSEVAAHQAQRDAWLAYIDLQAVLSGAVVSFSSTPNAVGTAPAANPGH